MIRQYHPQRFCYERVGGVDRPCGTIPIGTIVRLPCERQMYRSARRKHIVRAWLPRRIGVGRCVDGVWCDAFVGRGGHLALVEDLGDGFPSLVAHWMLAEALEVDG